MIHTQKQRGRKKKPYRHCVQEWTSNLERALPVDRGSFFADIRNPDTIDSTVLHLLENEDSAMCRSAMQSFLITEGACLIEFSGSLKRLISDTSRSSNHRLYKHSEECGDSRPIDIYAYGRIPTPMEIKYLSRLHRLKNATLTPNVLGKIGEQFVRAHLIPFGEFTGMSRKEKLGNVTVNGSDALDLVVNYRGIRYGIEVKNKFEAIHGRKDGIVDELIKKCQAHTAAGKPTHPWLIASYASKNGIEYCRRMGVGLTVLGFQIYPCRVRTPDGKGHNISAFVDEVRAVLGPRPFQAFGARVVDSSNLKTQRLMRYLLTPIVPPYGYSVLPEVLRLGVPERLDLEVASI